MREEADDADLVATARAGDADAFDALVRRHTAPVYRVALRILGDAHDAQDATQDAFLDAWKGLGSFRGDSAFGTWIYQIVTRRCLRVLRRRRHAAPLPEVLVSTAPGPERIAQDRGQLRHVEAVLAGRLTHEQRVALVLREVEGCSYGQIAEIVGSTVPAVKGRIHRARVQVVEATRGWR